MSVVSNQGRLCGHGTINTTLRSKTPIMTMSAVSNQGRLLLLLTDKRCWQQWHAFTCWSLTWGTGNMRYQHLQCCFFGSSTRCQRKTMTCFATLISCPLRPCCWPSSGVRLLSWTHAHLGKGSLHHVLLFFTMCSKYSTLAGGPWHCLSAFQQGLFIVSTISRHLDIDIVSRPFNRGCLYIVSTIWTLTVFVGLSTGLLLSVPFGMKPA